MSPIIAVSASVPETRPTVRLRKPRSAARRLRAVSSREIAEDALYDLLHDEARAAERVLRTFRADSA